MRRGLAFSVLPPALKTRFSELFSVASRKSIAAWQESELPDAQVVVLDVSAPALRLRPLPPCVIWLGKGPCAYDTSGAAWEGRLAQDYTVSDLIDMLDRAAVFLLDWAARQKAAGASAGLPGNTPGASYRTGAATSFFVDAMPPASEVVIGTAQEKTYRLNAWVFLPAPFDSADCISALALLTRQPVTVQQLQTHSGLPSAALSDLLQELARRNVLQLSSSSPVPCTATPSQRVAFAHKGFVHRLSHWLKRGGSQ